MSNRPRVFSPIFMSPSFSLLSSTIVQTLHFEGFGERPHFRAPIALLTSKNSERSFVCDVFSMGNYIRAIGKTGLSHARAIRTSLRVEWRPLRSPALLPPSRCLIPYHLPIRRDTLQQLHSGLTWLVPKLLAMIPQNQLYTRIRARTCLLVCITKCV